LYFPRSSRNVRFTASSRDEESSDSVLTPQTLSPLG
jgi:hypothetical protein